MVEFKKAPRPPEPVVDARADLDAIGFSGSPLEAVVAAIGAGLCLFGAVRILAGARRAFRGGSFRARSSRSTARARGGARP